MNHAHVVDETANIMAMLYDGTRLPAKLNWPQFVETPISNRPWT